MKAFFTCEYFLLSMLIKKGLSFFLRQTAEQEVETLSYHIPLLSEYRKEERREMEDASKIALAFYSKATPEQKKKASEFFERMDANGDGKVTFDEFRAASRELERSKHQLRHLFNQLDTNGDGTLDFLESLALFWICRNPSCDGCGNPLLGMYFTCPECHLENENCTYDLCSDCYQSGKISHSHTILVDNFSLLLAYRQILKTEISSRKIPAVSGSLPPTNFAASVPTPSHSLPPTNFAASAPTPSYVPPPNYSWPPTNYHSRPTPSYFPPANCYYLPPTPSYLPPPSYNHTMSSNQEGSVVQTMEVLLTGLTIAQIASNLACSIM